MSSSVDTTVLGSQEGEYAQIGPMGVRFMIDGERSGGGFSLVEHPIEPLSLAAPLHVHEREDEYTYVLEGEIGVQIGDDVHIAKAGELVFKPRGVPHAFWNAADAPARALEIISPAGFERFFAELEPLMNRPEGPDFAAVAALQEKYGMTMDFDSIEPLIERHGLRPL